MGKKAELLGREIGETQPELDIINELDQMMIRARMQNDVLQRMIGKMQETEKTKTKNMEQRTTLERKQSRAKVKESLSEPKIKKRSVSIDNGEEIRNATIEQLIIDEAGKEVLDLVRRSTGTDPLKTYVTSTTTRFNIEKLPSNIYENMVNLKRVNDVRRINKLFETVNSKLPLGGTYIHCVETYSNRKARILKKFIYPLNWIHYTLDVILKRVFPKVPITKNIYFFITKGRNRALSKAETFGRLYSCGFEVMEEKLIGNRLFFVVKKVAEPAFDKNPTYGPLIKLRRHGKEGELFNVYKMRTMYAYSEYLQAYVYQQNNLQEGGKFKDDFRITTEGKLFRKFWLDEVPMILNLVKGNMKLVGVRPLSSHYFNLYTQELKNKRIETKPGLIPPFYADMPKTLEEIMDSELRYLEAYKKHPYFTDIKYFFMAGRNIFFRKARSN